ncbi:UNVERIFIED_CONTAM: hypothetical protein FKN15_051839 [Acipenser sinensis]
MLQPSDMYCYYSVILNHSPIANTHLHYQQQEQDPTNLYISNLPISMDEQELENMLKPFGHVISTRILRDANGLHIVHYNSDKYASFAEAKDKADGLAVLAFIYECLFLYDIA